MVLEVHSAHFNLSTNFNWGANSNLMAMNPVRHGMVSQLGVQLLVWFSNFSLLEVLIDLNVCVSDMLVGCTLGKYFLGSVTRISDSIVYIP